MRGIVAFLLALVHVCAANMHDEMRVPRAWEDESEIRETPAETVPSSEPTSVPSSVPSSIPSSMPSNEPTSLPTLFEIKITVGITQVLVGFPSLDDWTDNEELSNAYVKTVAQRLEVDEDFISAPVAAMVSSRRRLSTAGLSVYCNASIPNVEPGSTDSDVTSLVNDELTSDANGSFLQNFTENVSETPGNMNQADIDSTVGAVEDISTEPVAVLSSILTDAPTPAPTRAPTTSPVDDEEDDVTAIVFGAVFGCVGFLGACVAYMNRDYLFNTHENQLDSIDDTHDQTSQNKPFMHTDEL